MPIATESKQQADQGELDKQEQELYNLQSSSQIDKIVMLYRDQLHLPIFIWSFVNTLNWFRYFFSIGDKCPLKNLGKPLDKGLLVCYNISEQIKGCSQMKNDQITYQKSRADEIYDTILAQGGIYITLKSDVWSEWDEGLPTLKKALCRTKKNTSSKRLDEWCDQFNISTSELIQYILNAEYKKDRSELALEQLEEMKAYYEEPDFDNIDLDDVVA